MSCGRIALEKAGIDVNNYYASEVDKYAKIVSKANYPDITQLGCVVKLSEMLSVFPQTLGNIDLLIGGSPCQGFSFAGKQLNFDDPRSKLFFEFVKIKNLLKPKYFLLENVKMKKESQDVITKIMGVEPIEINSSLVSAQNRKRLYWTNILGVTQPEDKGILLKDIIETGVADRDKSFCLDANYFKGGNLEQYFNKHRRQLVFSKDGLCHVGNADIKGNECIKRVYSVEGKGPCLTTMGGGHREPKILNDVVFCFATRGRYNKEGEIEQKHEFRPDQKTNCLTTVQKDNQIIDLNRKTWRKLTPLECERLQTVPDNYTNHVSNSQRYKMLGNGWTVDIIAHIFKHINTGG